MTVHQAVALAFIGPPCGLHVDHENNKRWDNRLSNLRYLTQLENAQRAWPNILTVDLVERARIEFASGEISASDLADQYGVAIPTMCQALEGTTWANAGGPVTTENKKAKLKKKDLIAIGRRLVKGESNASIASDYGVTRQAIGKVPDRLFAMRGRARGSR